MSTVPGIALERMQRLRRMYHLVGGSHRALQNERSVLQQNVERSVLALRLSHPTVTEHGGQAIVRRGDGSFDRVVQSDHLAAALARARAELQSHNELAAEIGRRAATLREAVEGCEGELKARYGWREEPR